MAVRHECDPAWETIDHRQQCDYSASTATRVTTLTRESTDGHRDGTSSSAEPRAAFMGRRVVGRTRAGPTPMRENAAGDR